MQLTDTVETNQINIEAFEFFSTGTLQEDVTCNLFVQDISFFLYFLPKLSMLGNSVDSDNSSHYSIADAIHVPTPAPTPPQLTRAQKFLIESQYRAVIEDHGGSWDKVPSEVKDVLHLTCSELTPEMEATFIESLEKELREPPQTQFNLLLRTMEENPTKLILPNRPSSLRPLSARPGSARKPTFDPTLGRSTPRKDVPSKLRDYIRAGRVQCTSRRSPVETICFLRVLNEIQLRNPGLQRLSLQYGPDLTKPEAQMKCFAEIFNVLDEYGNKALSIDQIVSFGRKIGGCTKKLFSVATFGDTSAGESTTLSVTGFLDALFPNEATSRKNKVRQQDAGGMNTRQKNNELFEGWHEDDVKDVLQLFKACNPNQQGLISLKSFRALFAADIDPLLGSSFIENEVFHKYDADKDNMLTLAELAAFMKPSLETSRRKAAEDEDVDLSDSD